MKKQLFYLLIVAGLLAVMVGCNDNVSEVGDSLSPAIDKVDARMDSLKVETSTVLTDSVVSHSTYTLLGDLQDPVYGHLKTDYIVQLQSARGFKFEGEPKDGKIDSIKLVISYGAIAGDSTAWLRATAFEVKEPLPKSHYSTDISNLIRNKILLGAKTYQPASKRGIHELKITLPQKLGQKIYELSKTNPEAFATDQSFYKNVLGGLYVTTTTGTGNIISIYNNRVDIYYQYKHTYKNKDGQDSVGWMNNYESFANTKQQTLVNHFVYQGNEKLIKEGQGNETFIKSPAGVTTQLVLKKEDLSKLVEGNSLSKRVVNQAILNIETEQMDNKVILNPPKTLILLPADSVKSFFENQLTEKTEAKTTYISNDYSVQERNYRFGNIARLIGVHLENHTVMEGGRKMVDKDLVMYLIPTRRMFKKTGYYGNVEETVSIDNYIFPSAVKLYMGKNGLKLGIITTAYN